MRDDTILLMIEEATEAARQPPEPKKPTFWETEADKLQQQIFHDSIYKGGPTYAQQKAQQQLLIVGGAAVGLTVVAVVLWRYGRRILNGIDHVVVGFLAGLIRLFRRAAARAD
jgi:hypothetical protein